MSGFHTEGKHPVAEGSVGGTVSVVATQAHQEYSVKLADVGGWLWYRGCIERRRVAMEERVIRLSMVAEQVDLASVDRIVLRLEALDSLGEQAIVLISNVKLLGKGP